MELIDKLKLEDLVDDQYYIAELIGIDNYKLLIEHFGGSNVYFPKTETLLVNARNNQIREEFNGFNYKALAKKYGLSEAWVREITQTVRYKAENNPNQLNMWDAFK